MPIKSQTELQAAAKEAGRLLQEIQDFKGRELCSLSRIRFPRGWIRPASEHRARLPFISNKPLRDNLAYTLILSDVIHWTIVRTDISGTAREMLIKQFLFLAGTMIESITKDYLKGRCGQNFGKRVDYMVAHGIITPELKLDLDWTWEMRNRMHLFLINNSEYNLSEYTPASHNRAVMAFRQLIQSLSQRPKSK